MPSGHRANRIRRAATNAADPELKAVACDISLRYLRYLLFKDESHTMHPLFFERHYLKEGAVSIVLELRVRN